MNSRFFSNYAKLQLATVAVLLLIVGNVGFSQEKNEETQVKIFSLKHAPVKDALHSVGDLINHNEHPTLRLTTDPRTNSIVASGTVKSLDLIEELLLYFDKQPVEPKKSTSENVFESFKLPAEVDVRLTQRIVATALGSNSRARVDVDPDLGVLYFSGDKEQISLIQRVLNSLMDSVPKGHQGNAYVSVTFVVDAGQVGAQDMLEELKKPSAKINAVLDKAESVGLVDLEKPMVCAKVTNRVKLVDRQTLQVKTQQGQPPGFTNSSKSASGFYSMDISGGLAQEGETCILKADVFMKITTKGDAELNANIELPMNHPVIMSVSTIVGIDSLLIVEVQNAD